MLRLVLIATTALATGCVAASAPRVVAPRPHPDDARAAHVILFLGDGMGDSEITLARNYARGAAGRLAMDGLPFTGAYTTYAVRKGTHDVPEYVTDSSASGTAWATGRKTYNGAVSVDPVTLAPLPTILELAQRAGFRTGSVTSGELTDATPGALTAHLTERDCEGPADMAKCPSESKTAGGLGSVAEQTVDHGIDVVLGGGRARFERAVSGGPFAGKTVTEQARAQGYRVVTDQAGLATARPGTKLLGLFADGNMESVWTGPRAQPYPGPAAGPCTETNPARPAGTPHLAAMTTAALRLLSAPVEGDARRGFFLQVEGALIDKQDHAANPCPQIGETVEFDRAIAVALDWAKYHPDTLIVVAADHGHTSQILPPQTDTNHSPGSIATLITADRRPMVVGYATNLPGRSQTHTGTQIRVAAQGPQAASVLGLTDQTDLFHTMARALGIE
jgi:alkaline phosphatase